MELQLVSFEQAKALKELGFPQDIDTTKWYSGGRVLYSNKLLDYLPVSFVAPALEIVAKWLRDEKNILIEPCTKAFSTNGFFKCFVLNCSKDCTKCAEYQIYWTDFGGDNVCFPNWETALSAGIDKAIEILKSNNND